MAHRRKQKDLRKADREAEERFYSENSDVLQGLRDVLLEEAFYEYCAESGCTPDEVLRDIRRGAVPLDSIELMPGLTLDFWMADVCTEEGGSRHAGTPDEVQCPADGSPLPDDEQVDDD